MARPMGCFHLNPVRRTYDSRFDTCAIVLKHSSPSFSSLILTPSSHIPTRHDNFNSSIQRQDQSLFPKTSIDHPSTIPRLRYVEPTMSASPAPSDADQTQASKGQEQITFRFCRDWYVSHYPISTMSSCDMLTTLQFEYALCQRR